MKKICISCGAIIPDGPNPKGCIDCRTEDVTEKARIAYECPNHCGTFCEDELTSQNCPICGAALKEKAA